MRAGKLRHKIIIQRKSTAITRGDYGEETQGWTTFKELHAEIDPPKSREFFATGQTQAEVTTRVRIRYIPNIEPTMRVKFGSRYMNINSIINPDERNRELIMMCNEWVTGETERG
jgi:SPP1 family predicted phage head-tail adaptor